jgi:hypothetical protein
LIAAALDARFAILVRARLFPAIFRRSLIAIDQHGGGYFFFVGPLVAMLFVAEWLGACLVRVKTVASNVFLFAGQIDRA